MEIWMHMNDYLCASFFMKLIYELMNRKRYNE